MKFVLVSGGVISGIGKGLTASSLGVLLKCCGWRVTSIKIDPYINVDAGTMSPFEHGEVFVLDDGGEVDLDLGNYERFLDINLTSESNITTGKIYQQVIEKERQGMYLGKTVQVIPHVTDAIQDWILRVSKKPVDDSGLPPEICVIELGGTVGDIESMPFVEALRQLKYHVGEDNFCSVFVSLVPELGVVGEQKTKPTQHGVKNLSSMGLSPQLIVCRSERPLLAETKQKLGLFCQVPPEAVVSVHDVSNTFRIPLMLQEQGVCNLLIRSLKLVWRLPTLLERWNHMACNADIFQGITNIAVVGKYTGLADSYLSIVKALLHVGMSLHTQVNIHWISAEDLEVPSSSSLSGNRKENSFHQRNAVYDKAWQTLSTCDGILLPGGFGTRGIEGMLSACRYARESNKPFLGICLGMQVAIIEVARNVVGMSDGNSEEFDSNASTKVIIYMPEIDKLRMGGTMRLGSRVTRIRSLDSLGFKLYRSEIIHERHRHRYEVNPQLVKDLEELGNVAFTGCDETGQRMEILEIPKHRFFMGTQYHPELKSRPGRPSPPFLGFIMAASGHSLDEESIERILREIEEQNPWSQKVSNGELNL
ncbi:CTP synthase [Galdieria sulphuraria]|uniref:CTP synthase n=1 Tax=Galdieria sulphuraria TaxID=130081 RepID=M2Y8S4_GALSU|nr:CTP synthase isoform 1 [Galdieria sulphuraria]EME32468.1 CTP synthase isoform 1 [Galdieria sulphuraria]GJD08139.1 CTP synthase [Galdieria sulphuraria]|eukprot:XP_005708988.1 CTP synthase isoform 1 [Galdieria sulphuraria]